MSLIHLVHCQSCCVAYRETHYHCCLCPRVFGSASAFERHAKARETRRHVASDLQLQHLGLFETEIGVWKQRGTFSKHGRRMPISA
jgi:hypothetical protein